MGSGSQNGDGKPKRASLVKDFDGRARRPVVFQTLIDAPGADERVPLGAINLAPTEGSTL